MDTQLGTPNLDTQFGTPNLRDYYVHATCCGTLWTHCLGHPTWDTQRVYLLCTHNLCTCYLHNLMWHSMDTQLGHTTWDTGTPNVCAYYVNTTCVLAMYTQFGTHNLLWHSMDTLLGTPNLGHPTCVLTYHVHTTCVLR